MRVSFADAELEAKEGQYSNGCVATVRVRLDRRRDMESTVIIPIYRTLHGGATDGVDFAAVPDHLVFLPGQTEHSFPVRPINDDIDDDGEYVTFGFGTLPDLVYAGDQTTVRVNLVDDDDPPVDVFFEQANYEVTNVRTSGNGKAEYARLDVKVKLSAVPERFVDVGIIAESMRGGGGIHFEYSAYIPRGPHDGAHFYADDTEFTLQVYISALGGFDPNQNLPAQFQGHVLQDVRGQSRNSDHHHQSRQLAGQAANGPNAPHKREEAILTTGRPPPHPGACSGECAATGVCDTSHRAQLASTTLEARKTGYGRQGRGVRQALVP